MVYKHQYFQLDTESKRVFDENGKELLLTGNAYRMLVFLCANKNATLTQIGDFLDYAKEYTENHLRQYRYKISTIIGNGIVEYKNGVYSLIGSIGNADKISTNDRNTDLLHQNPIQSEHKTNSWLKFVKYSKVPAIIAVIVLLLSFLNWPYGYYNFLRIVVTAASAYYAYYLYTRKLTNAWFWILLVSVILFNPFAPIYIKDKFTWEIIDILTAGFFIVFIQKKYE